MTKPNYSYIPPRVLEEVAHVFTHGAQKHSPFGWVDLPETQTHMHGASQRHITDWRKGIRMDSESGRHPLAHAIARLMMLMAYDFGETEWKDGPQRREGAGEGTPGKATETTAKEPWSNAFEV